MNYIKKSRSVMYMNKLLEKLYIIVIILLFILTIISILTSQIEISLLSIILEMMVFDRKENKNGFVDKKSR